MWLAQLYCFVLQAWPLVSGVWGVSGVCYGGSRNPQGTMD